MLNPKNLRRKNTQVLILNDLKLRVFNELRKSGTSSLGIDSKGLMGALNPLLCITFEACTKTVQDRGILKDARQRDGAEREVFEKLMRGHTTR